MATIKKVEKYKYEGKEYDSLEQVKRAVEDKLGIIINIINNITPLSPKQKIDIFNALVYKKEFIVDCLTVDYDEEIDGSGLHGDYKNILDL